MSQTLLQRNNQILDRANDLGGIAGPIADLLEQDKRAQLLTGVDADGHAFAPLAPATLKGRLPGPPLLPGGASGRLCREYRVQVERVERGALTITAGWPGLDFVRFLRTGTRRMPRRDPGGFRAAAVTECRRLFRAWLMGGRPRG